MESKVSLFTVFILIFSTTNGTIFDKCGTGAPIPDSLVVTVNDKVCDKPPCPIPQNSTINFDMKFVAKNYLENIKPEVWATASGFSIPWPLGNDACDYINTICPIVEGEIIEYQQSMNIGNGFPPVSAYLEISIVDKDADESNNGVVCVAFTIQVE